MTSYKRNDRDDRHHHDVWAVLPWYVTGTLSSHEGSRVEAHLAVCAACQAEIGRCRDLATAVQTPLSPAWEPSAEHFTRLMTRLEVADARRTLLHACWEHLQRWYEHGQQLRQYTPRPVQWTLAVQGALALLFASVLVWQYTAPPTLLVPLYRTLSDGSATLPGDVHMRVVFTDDMTAREIRTLLHSVEGSIVQGPSSVGAYTVAVSVPAQAPARLHTILTQLRTHPQVRLAEPLTAW
jgi:anti-sigma factor RsiW